MVFSFRQCYLYFETCTADSYLTGRGVFSGGNLGQLCKAEKTYFFQHVVKYFFFFFKVVSKCIRFKKSLISGIEEGVRVAFCIASLRFVSG